MATINGRTAVSVWLRFDNDEDETPDYEANIIREEDGTFTVEWWHDAVGQVTQVRFETYEAACVWLEENNYRDFTSE
jgi:hypothetical protein